MKSTPSDARAEQTVVTRKMGEAGGRPLGGSSGCRQWLSSVSMQLLATQAACGSCYKNQSSGRLQRMHMRAFNPTLWT